MVLHGGKASAGQNEWSSENPGICRGPFLVARCAAGGPSMVFSLAPVIQGASGFRSAFVSKAKHRLLSGDWTGSRLARDFPSRWKDWGFAVLLAARGPEHLYRPRRSGTTTKNKARRAAKARADLVLFRNSKAYRRTLRDTVAASTCSRAPLPTSPVLSTWIPPSLLSARSQEMAMDWSAGCTRRKCCRIYGRSRAWVLAVAARLWPVLVD
jgi:hypothetical protein